MTVSNTYADGANTPTGNSADTGSQGSASKSTVSKDMFLQLLVAQIRNQDPLNPSDGTEFLSQLAQLQELEQGINTGTDVAAIRSSIEGLAAATEITSKAA